MSSTYLYCLATPACVPMVTQLSAQEGGGAAWATSLCSLEHNGIVAVVAEVDAKEFSEQNLQSLEWLGPRAYRHAAVVEQVMSASPVLPVKFGTLFESSASLIRLLTQHRELIAAFLEKVSGKSEWTLKGYVDEERARGHARTVNPDLDARLAALDSATPGVRYMQQKQLAGLLSTALREWVERQAQRISEVLQVHAAETAALRLLPGSVPGDPGSAAFDRNFLVADAALPTLRAAFSALCESEREAGLTLELKGPWPPYHFCPDLKEQT